MQQAGRSGASRTLVPLDQLVSLLPGGFVLMGPSGVLLAARALAIAERVASRDGIRTPGDAEALRETLLAAVADARRSRSGSEEVPLSDGVSASAVSSMVLVDPVGTADAAVLLACTPRAVRARCRRGALASAVRSGKAWLIERHEIEGEVAARAARCER